MKQKQLQKKSRYAEYDIDGDGIVSDEELSNMKDIKETFFIRNTRLELMLSQRRAPCEMQHL